MFLTKPIRYLEFKDFNNYNLKKEYSKGKTCVIMVQSNHCNYCTDVKPYFQEFSEKHKNINCFTIQEDGDRGDEIKMLELVSRIKPTFRGFPDYLLFKNGKFIDKKINGRNVKALEEFVKN